MCMFILIIKWQVRLQFQLLYNTSSKNGSWIGLFNRVVDAILRALEMLSISNNLNWSSAA